MRVLDDQLETALRRPQINKAAVPFLWSGPNLASHRERVEAVSSAVTDQEGGAVMQSNVPAAIPAVAPNVPNKAEASSNAGSRVPARHPSDPPTPAAPRATIIPRIFGPPVWPWNRLPWPSSRSCFLSDPIESTIQCRMPVSHFTTAGVSQDPSIPGLCAATTRTREAVRGRFGQAQTRALPATRARERFRASKRRLFIRLPHRRGRAGSAAPGGQAPWRL
jgi:hypothetical protein